jgi:hypothetical protein
MNTESIRKLIFDEIELKGYILIHDLSREIITEIHNLIDSGMLIQLDKLPATKSFMNSSYKATYADNPYDLQVHSENSMSRIVKTKNK